MDGTGRLPRRGPRDLLRRVAGRRPVRQERVRLLPGESDVRGVRRHRPGHRRTMGRPRPQPSAETEGPKVSEPAAQPPDTDGRPRLALVPAGPKPGEVEVVTPDEP